MLELSDDQAAFRAVAQRFARDRIAPDYQKREQAGVVDRKLVREMGGLGLIAPELPEDFGGLGTPSVTSGLIAEAIGHADVNVAYVQILGSLNGKIIASHAPADLKARWLPRIISGDAIVALGLTEPRGGSDARTSVGLQLGLAQAGFVERSTRRGKSCLGARWLRRGALRRGRGGCGGERRAARCR